MTPDTLAAEQTINKLTLTDCDCQTQLRSPEGSSSSDLEAASSSTSSTDSSGISAEPGPVESPPEISEVGCTTDQSSKTDGVYNRNELI